jgi:ABC-2 type transport system ATP-binding protein
METVIALREVSKQYGSLRAVDGVSFRVEAGEVFGLLGPNGAGKTTIVEMIEGLRRPDDGSIVVHGTSSRSGAGAREIKERTGVLLQATTLYDRIRVGEAIDLFRGYYRTALPTSMLLERFSLTEKRKAYVGRLSGGQRQRLALALAVVNDPDLIFLDEPTTGLDPQARRNVWEIVRGLREQKKTIVLTTHYMEEAEELCNRVAILDHGEIIALDSPDALISAADLGSRVELGAVGTPMADAIENAGLPATVVRENQKLILHTMEPSAVLARLTQIAAEYGTALDDLSVRRPTLEDVFLALTGRHLRE